ncbi:ABC transporter ATP-binding protein [Amycolatopsis sp. CA-128772]|uniref:ABC transporter ATP-binding protein n=1 Tax=Amycolatopsis sp. CA-128772 TaxID=2073159 RepID=UPI001E540549|nr:ABC transporter ATP-binding protein [Amycolatopsis sp. CA-128772]
MAGDSAGPDDDNSPTHVALIGAENLATPKWARVGEDVASAGVWRSVRTLPSAFSMIAGLAWKTSRRLAVFVALTHAASGVAAAYGLLMTADVFSALLRDGPTLDKLAASLPAMVLVIATYATRAVMESAASAVEGTLRPRVIRAADGAVTAAVLRVGLLDLEDADFQELARRGSQDGVEYIGLGVQQVARLFGAAVSMLAALVTAGLLNPWLPLVLLLGASADAWASGRVVRLNRRHFLDNVTREMRKSVVGTAATSRDFALERHALTLQDRLQSEYDRIADGLMYDEIRLARRSTGIRLAGRAIAGVGTGAAYGVLLLLLWTAAMPLAVAGTALLAMRTAATALTNSLREINQLHEGAFHLEMYRELVDEAVRRRQPRRALKAPEDPRIIRLTNVSFTYPGQDRPALHELDLTIRRGEVVALVGENGSGKTTLGKVLTGLFPATSGTVTWDDVDLAAADPLSAHEQVAVIAQNPAEWPMTAENNIRVGRLSRDDRDGFGWRQAISLSGADEVIDGLPYKEKTLLSRRFQEGQDLSGGQWQRIGVARGIYRDAALLVADEPTAALDARAEARVFDGLRSASLTGEGTRTTILVTHRLANVRSADRIVVLEGGRIVEQGTHDQLQAAGGLYSELYEIQAAAYRETAEF